MVVPQAVAIGLREVLALQAAHRGAVPTRNETFPLRTRRESSKSSFDYGIVGGGGEVTVASGGGGGATSSAAGAGAASIDSPL